MEFTTARPCTHLRPARITFQSDESTITGTRAMSGSPASMFRNVVISARASSRPSSMFMSMSCAPSSTCLRAMSNASAYFFSFIRRRNFLEPATLQRSPTLMKFMLLFTTRRSSPESQSSDGFATGTRGCTPSVIGGNRAIYSSVVPQQPPTMFTSPSSMYSRTISAISSGVWS